MMITIHIPSDIDRMIFKAYDAMTDGDKSSLLEMLKRPDIELLTVDGSPNAEFWRALEAIGWARPVAIDVKIAAAMPAARSWTFAEDGAAKLTVWLMRLFESKKRAAS